MLKTSAKVENHNFLARKYADFWVMEGDNSPLGTFRFQTTPTSALSRHFRGFLRKMHNSSLIKIPYDMNDSIRYLDESFTPNPDKYSSRLGICGI